MTQNPWNNNVVFLKGRLLEAMAARKRLEAWLEEWKYNYGERKEFTQLHEIVASLPEEEAV